jgi:hypothetical protein
MAKYSSFTKKSTGEKFIRDNTTGREVFESVDPVEYRALHKKWKTNLAKAQREEAFKSCGLIKAKGAVSGKTYWE